MSATFTLLIHPAPHDDVRADWSDSFREVDLAEPALRVGELSTQRGDGIFETIGLVDGHAQEVGPHLDRLAHSARLSDLDMPNRDQWRAAVALAEQRMPARGEFAIRLVLSRGVENGPAPTAWLVAQPAANNAAIRANGMAVVTLNRGFARDTAENAPWLLLGAKTLSYAINMAAIREAKRRGAGDALFVSSDGYLLEGPTSSLIIRRNGVYETPAPSGSILHGTTQLSLFEFLEGRGDATAYRDIPVSDLAEVDAAWLVSSVRLAVGITAIDGRKIPFDVEATADFNRYLLSPRD
ncbi:MAG TPA: aminotransferase class IV [Microbacteriaceae bacterium]|nr:aminotransferase class IV [Microbacteriaceae bacterium]